MLLIEGSEIIIWKSVWKLTKSGFWQTVKLFSDEVVSTTSFLSLEGSNAILYVVWVAISRKINNHMKKTEIFTTLFEKLIYCCILAGCKTAIYEHTVSTFSETYQYSTQWAQVCKLNGLYLTPFKRWIQSMSFARKSTAAIYKSLIHQLHKILTVNFWHVYCSYCVVLQWRRYCGYNTNMKRPSQQLILIIWGSSARKLLGS